MYSSVQKIAKATIYSILLLLVAGIAFSSRDFAKYQIGFLYVSEAVFLAWLVLALVATPQAPLSAYLTRAMPLVGLLVWGVVWLIRDILHVLSSGDPIQYMRIAQHSLLYIYPIMWVTVGMWCYDQFPKTIRFLVVTTLVTTWPNFVGRGVSNLSLGPLMAIPWAYFISHEALTPRIQPYSKSFWIKGFVLTFLACAPFWHMWLTSLQRTSFLSFLLMLVVIPWIMRKPSDSLLSTCKSTALLLMIYLGGQAVALAGFMAWNRAKQPSPPQITMAADSAQPIIEDTPAQPIRQKTSTPSPLSKYASHPMIMAIQHGEDRPTAGRPQQFQMRMRRFMWKTAIEDWRKSPWLGIGSIPEVPSYIQPGVANTTRAMHGLPPIAGPHNSYLTVLARMGPIGLLLLGGFFAYVIVRVGPLTKAPVTLTDLFLICVPMNGAVYALFNSGFESPQNCLVMWLFMGIAIAKSSALMTRASKSNASARNGGSATRSDERAKVLC